MILSSRKFVKCPKPEDSTVIQFSTEIQACLTPKVMQKSKHTVLWPEWITASAWHGWLWATASKTMVMVIVSPSLSQSLGWDSCFHIHHWVLISLGYRNPLCYPMKANTFPKFLIPGCSGKKGTKRYSRLPESCAKFCSWDQESGTWGIDAKH